MHLAETTRSWLRCGVRGLMSPASPFFSHSSDSGSFAKRKEKRKVVIQIFEGKFFEANVIRLLHGSESRKFQTLANNNSANSLRHLHSNKTDNSGRYNLYTLAFSNKEYIAKKPVHA
jgi:hypothetical protein